MAAGGVVVEQGHRRALFGAASAGLFLFGIVLALLGTLFGLPEMRARLHVDLSEQGNLFLLLYFGVLVASLVVGPLIGRAGNKLVLLVSALLVMGALAGFAAAESFATAAICAAALGLGGGGLNTSTNALVSDLYGDARGKMLNALAAFYCLGALLLPLVAAGLSAIYPMRRLVLGMLVGAAVLAAVAAAVFAALRFPAARQSRSFSPVEMLRVAYSPGVPLLALLLFCQSGNESAIGGWASSYAGLAGASARTATWVLAGYWAAMLVGRTLAIWLLRRMGKTQLLLLSAAGSLAGCTLVLLSHRLAGLAAALVLVGASFAPIYPTVLGIAGDRYPQISGTVFGMLFSLGITGGMTFPWVIAQISERLGMRAGMLLPVAGAAVICVLAGRILVRDKRAARTTAQARAD